MKTFTFGLSMLGLAGVLSGNASAQDLASQNVRYAEHPGGLFGFLGDIGCPREEWMAIARENNIPADRLYSIEKDRALTVRASCGNVRSFSRIESSLSPVASTVEMKQELAANSGSSSDRWLILAFVAVPALFVETIRRQRRAKTKTVVVNGKKNTMEVVEFCRCKARRASPHQTFETSDQASGQKNIMEGFRRDVGSPSLI